MIVGRIKLQDILANKGVRWIGGGWLFFITENVVISHNREPIIQQFGDKNYHYVYNTLSTAACASIGYGFFKHRTEGGPILRPQNFNLASWHLLRLPAFALTTLGLIGFSQLVPKVRLPFGEASSQEKCLDVQKRDKKEENGSMVARCPLDFTPPDIPKDGIYGLQRVTRHPQLWSLGSLGAGAALCTPYLPQVAFFSGPLLFAMIGTSHIDHRYRRNIGGTLTPEKEAVTSNIPFCALLTGRQSWSSLAEELKWTNASIATILAIILQLRRGRAVSKITV